MAYSLDTTGDIAPRIAISDLRFEDEADMVRSKGGHVVHILAGNRLPPLPKDAHISEHGIALKSGDKIINNISTLFEFEDNLWRLADSLGLRAC
jgi:hypothetical protein